MVTGQAARRRQNLKRQKELREKGICFRCRKEKAREGKIYCQDCADKESKRLKEFHKNKKKWKKQKI